MKRIISLCLVFFLVCASSAQAQESETSLTGLERALDLTLDPLYPSPGDSVRMSITTFALDLSLSNVVWMVNGEEISRGLDLTEATITVGGLGSESHVVVIAEEQEGIVASAEARIRPAEIDIVWEADSYVPPFYRGRALPGSNSPIRAQAVGRFATDGGTAIPTEDIVYTWYRNDAVVEKGRGKSIVTVPGPSLFSTDTLRVVAVSADGAHSSAASADIPSTDPFVMLHENHPLFGILYHRSLEQGAITMETEQRVTAVPYFASILSPRDAGLLYEWAVNDSRIDPNPEEPQTLTITAEGYTGPADISLAITNADDIFLRAQGTWQLIFGEQSAFLSNLNPFGN